MVEVGGAVVEVGGAVVEVGGAVVGTDVWAPVIALSRLVMTVAGGFGTALVAGTKATVIIWPLANLSVRGSPGTSVDFLAL